jgi:WD40 repeat protein
MSSACCVRGLCQTVASLPTLGLLLCLLASPTPSSAQSFARPELVVQTGHTRRVTTLAFSADERLLASASDDHAIKVWDISTGLELRTLADPLVVGSGILASHEYAIAFSPDRRWVAPANGDGVTLWDLAMGRQV